MIDLLSTPAPTSGKELSDQIKAGEFLGQQTFDKFNLQQQDISGAIFTEIIFNYCDFSQCNLRQVLFNQC